jgi:hypothetical protein
VRAGQPHRHDQRHLHDSAQHVLAAALAESPNRDFAKRRAPGTGQLTDQPVTPTKETTCGEQPVH